MAFLDSKPNWSFASLLKNSHSTDSINLEALKAVYSNYESITRKELFTSADGSRKLERLKLRMWDDQRNIFLHKRLLGIHIHSAEEEERRQATRFATLESQHSAVSSRWYKKLRPGVLLPWSIEDDILRNRQVIVEPNPVIINSRTLSAFTNGACRGFILFNVINLNNFGWTNPRLRARTWLQTSEHRPKHSEENCTREKKLQGGILHHIRCSNETKLWSMWSNIAKMSRERTCAQLRHGTYAINQSSIYYSVTSRRLFRGASILTPVKENSL